MASTISGTSGSSLAGNSTAVGNFSVGGNLAVTGNTTLTGALSVTGNLFSSGSILQVVVGSTTTATTTSTTATAGVTTTLTASITPKSATSKVLVGAFFGQIQAQQTTAAADAIFSLYRDASQVIATWFAGPILPGANINMRSPGSGIYLDSPATTSSTTYTVYFRSNSTSTPQTVQVNSVPSYIVLFEVGV